MLLKKLHSLTLKSFLPPFTITLFVSVFLFFLVEIVITYLDDMIGKGLRTSDLLKLFFYSWVAIIPQCIPLAVLLGSIMCFGNLAENYELAAMKSSGLGLFRIMKPVLVFIVILAGLTFLFNNFIMPVVNLKAVALMYDIRQKKPSVNIKEGIFYNKIDNYSLRVGEKSANKDTLKEIYIYDHSAQQGNTIQMYANSGKMTTTADTSALVLILKDGNRYEEVKDRDSLGREKKFLSQLNFRSLQINIELKEFKLKRTDENQFKNTGEMLNIWQIDSVMDSTKRILNRRIVELKNQSNNYFFARSFVLDKCEHKDSIQHTDSLLARLKKEDRNRLIDAALNAMRNNATTLDGNITSFESTQSEISAFSIEWHRKIVVCFACIILFFVGAPLGAIIKKGGLGLPVVVAVFFFLAYFIITEGYTSMAIDGVMTAWIAMWIPLGIFLPISIFLTYKAARDSAIFDFITNTYWFSNLLLKFKPRAKSTANSK